MNTFVTLFLILIAVILTPLWIFLIRFWWEGCKAAWTMFE